MIQVTIFSGRSGELSLDISFYLTLFGGFELTRPTIARQILARRQAQRQGRLPGPRPFFLTIFGGGSIKCPTLAAEFIDMKETICGGHLDMADWERAMGDLGPGEPIFGSFTLFGGLDESGLPSEEQEIDSLAVQRHLGNISESAGQVLQYGIGQGGSERTATLRRAILATA